jgi:hypothetical protein
MKYFVLIFLSLFLILSNCFSQSAGWTLAAPCNVNVVCEPDWCNQWRSVALIFELEDDGFYDAGATGSLLNNEKRDGNPFF